MSSLILEGFMGSGKSTVAARLSEKLGLPLIDTDAEIERRAGKTISSIFAEEGEEAFRDMETECLKQIRRLQEKEPGDRVISLGGGMPVREENRALLKEIGTVIYLKAEPELLIRRLEKETGSRPMLSGKDLAERVLNLLGEREEAYMEAADVVILLEEGEDVAERIRKELKR